MPDYDAVKEIVGKTIKGVIVKQNPKPFDQPAMAVHLIFTDGTSYEIYAMYNMNFGRGLSRGNVEAVRKYLSPPMENVLDISVEDPQA